MRVTLLLGIGLLAAACGGSSNAAQSAQDAGSEGDAGSSPPVLASRTAALVSAPPRYALTGELYRYRPTANGAISSLSVEEGPPGLRARDSLLEWEPTTEQGGTHRVTIRGSTPLGAAAQSFNLDVASSTPRARGQISAGAGGSVVAAGTDSAVWRGVGVTILPGALADSAEVTVSELDRAPALPNARGRLRAARFQPAGTVFATPAQLMLPLPESMSDARRLRAYVYNPSGRWERVPLVAIDTDSNLAIARASHFSVYAAVEPALDLTTALGTAGASGPCAGALMGRAALDVPLAAVALESVNNLSPSVSASVSGDAPTVRDLLGLKGLRGSLRAVRVFALQEPGSEVLAEEAAAVSTLYAPGDGSVTVTDSDALGNALAQERFADPAAAASEIEAHLVGRATGVRFASAGSDGQTLAARLHLSFADGDASHEPVDTRDLGLAAVESDPVAMGVLPAALGDADCDGTLDAFDDVDDTLKPTLDVMPRQVVRAFPGESVTLRAKVAGGPSADEAWRVLDGTGAKLEPVSDGQAFSAADSGRFLVSYRASSGATALEHVFAIDVVRPPATNTPPRCQPTKASDSGRVGDALDLQAVASDAETEPGSLRVEWGLFDAATGGLTATPQLATSGVRARLLPTQAGTYVVGCRAFDGQLQGAVATVELTVAPVAENRTPDLIVSPRETTTTPALPVTVRAWATDRDGDALKSTWTVDGKAVTPTGTAADGKYEVRASAPGTIVVAVEVTDGRATARSTATVFVRDLAVPMVDADGDGYFAGSTPASDCNDLDAKVFPGAPERCNKIDDDCDGQIDEGACTTGGEDPCAASTNGGCDPLTRCVNTQGARTCTACPLGYSGSGETRCVDVDECADKSGCDPLSVCRNVPGGFECGGCPTGFIGTGSTGCVDIDECAVRNGGCDLQSTCTNTPGGFQCGACGRGYAPGANGCVDIDECAVDNGGCAKGVKCTNSPGSFVCGGCPLGYTTDVAGACVDVDECVTRNGGCDPLTKCTNTDGGRTCGACPSGYTGAGDVRCVDVDECLGTKPPCPSETICTNTTGSFECGCPAGFVSDGKSCVDVDECLPTRASPCAGGSTCTNTVGSYKCGCPPGTFDENGDGKVCSEPQKLSAGTDATCVITTTGSSFCWGRGFALTPYRLDNNSDWEDISVSWHRCGTRRGGQLYCWGVNYAGQLGIGGTADRYTPTQVGSDIGWTHVAVGWTHTCARRAESVYCWGDNQQGQVGARLETLAQTTPLKVGEQSDWFFVTAGYGGSCAIRSGSAYCWGAFGAGTTGPDQVLLDASQDWSEVSLGSSHGCGLRAGALYCWGDNSRGQLGIGTDLQRATVTRVGDSNQWTQVNVNERSTCGLVGGRVACWGDTGIIANSRVPVFAGQDSDWTAIATSATHHCGIKGARVYCWGQNNFHQLGDGSDMDSLTPTPVPVATPAKR